MTPVPFEHYHPQQARWLANVYRNRPRYRCVRTGKPRYFPYPIEQTFLP